MKTEDETGTAGTAVATDETEDVTKAERPGDGERDGVTGGEAGDTSDVEQREAAAETPEDGEAGGTRETGETGRTGKDAGVGLGAGAVVSAALGVVSLTGGWLGSVAGQRSQLIGGLQLPNSASLAKQIAVYGDAWDATALWAGGIALLALIVGVVVLVRPAFGSPERVQAAWIKSVAWAGVWLGVLGLLLAVLKYSGALLGTPSVG